MPFTTTITILIILVVVTTVTMHILTIFSVVDTVLLSFRFHADKELSKEDTVARKASATSSGTFLRAQWRGRRMLVVKLQCMCREITEHATGSSWRGSTSLMPADVQISRKTSELRLAA